PGPPHDRELAAPQYTGDRAEHKVPPLRFASVGMTELFRYVRVAALFRCAAGRFGSVASHPSAKNALRVGHPRFGLGGRKHTPQHRRSQ
ncbi:MAG: hypothetical protein WBE44_13485, partial [Terriglobales bacterium]